MKKPICVLLVLGASAAGAHAQWAVYDAAVHSQQIASSAKEIAKFVEMIGNQVKQLRVLEEDVATLRHYVDLFGTPSAARPASAPGLAAILSRPEVGHTVAALLARADPRAAMTDTAHGIFEPVGTAFQTPDGHEVQRAPGLYRATAAIQETRANFERVSTDATQRRAQLKAEITKTTTALADARTDAEVQKLGAVLVGLGSALQSTESEVSQATAAVLVQDAATRADERRQADARREEQAAQFTEALMNYGRTFPLMTAPVPFPPPR